MENETLAEGHIERKENTYWVYYLNPIGALTLDPKRCGKWMYITPDLRRADNLVREAVECGVVYEAKHSTEHQMATSGNMTAVCCFYLNGDDSEAHRRTIKFFIEHDLVRRTKSGRLYNISFKYDTQTRSGEYGKTFHAKICLADFIDLDTDEFLQNET